jgi:hypothetical protein
MMLSPVTKARGTLHSALAPKTGISLEKELSTPSIIGDHRPKVNSFLLHLHHFIQVYKYEYIMNI